MRWSQVLDHPVIVYLVVGIFSTAAAYMFSVIGQGFAEVVSEQPLVGISFKAGGALAGFILVFWLSVSILERLHALADRQGRTRGFKVFLIPRDMFGISEPFTCAVYIYDEEIGEERTLNLLPRRENGYLTIDIRDLQASERFRIELKDALDHGWKSEYCHPNAPRAEMQPL